VTISARKTMALVTISVLIVSVWSMTSAVSQTPSAEPVIEISSAGSRTASPGAASNFTGRAQVEQLFPARGASSNTTVGVLMTSQTHKDRRVRAAVTLPHMCPFEPIDQTWES
jgi:hypothetical protein